MKKVPADAQMTRDTPSALWIIPKGTFTVHIGASSDDIRLTGTFAI